MNASYISQITTALNERFPESNISRMIFTNDLEDKICCTDIPDAYSPTNNGGIDCFTLEQKKIIKIEIYNLLP